MYKSSLDKHKPRHGNPESLQNATWILVILIAVAAFFHTVPRSEIFNLTEADMWWVESFTLTVLVTLGALLGARFGRYGI